MMTEEQLKVMADDYAAEFEPMFRKVAKRAYIDGMKDAMEYMKKKLTEL